MRADGSLKSLVQGLSTIDDKRHNGTYAKTCTNMRNDPIEGLVRRPPLSLGNDLINLTDLLSAFFTAEIGNTPYWIYIPRDGQIRIWDMNNVEQFVDNSHRDAYYDSIVANISVAHASAGDVLYLANRVRTVNTIVNREEYNTDSLIVVKQAPAIFSKLRIEWVTSEGTPGIFEMEVGEGWDGSGIPPDTGTNTIADEIAQGITQFLEVVVSSDEVFSKGSTVAYGSADGTYAAITVEDGANGAVLAAINEQTENLSDLPKYAPHNQVVQIRPDTTNDKGVFYMKSQVYQAIPDEEAIQRADPVKTLTAGREDVWLDIMRIEGFIQDFDTGTGNTGQIGDLQPDFMWKERELWNIATFTGESTTDQSSNLAWTARQWGPPEDLRYCIIRDTETNRIIFDTPMIPMFEEGNDTEVSWWLSRDPGALWEEGHTYEVYDEEVEYLYGRLPEVEWIEWTHPEQRQEFNINNFPHVIAKMSEGVFVAGPMSSVLGSDDVHDIRPRRAGDDNTNPFPDFNGRQITDLAVFQNRLTCIAGDGLTMSVTDKYNGFFRETVTQNLATDPIGIKASGNGETLTWMVPHNNTMTVFSGLAQYQLDGNIALTPQNAALPMKSNYRSAIRAKPISNGNDIFFPILYASGKGGISRYTVDTDAETQNVAHPITDHVVGLLPNLDKIAGSSTLNFLVASSRLDNRKLYFLDYRITKQNPQLAWAEWTWTSFSNQENLSILDILVEHNVITLLIRVTSGPNIMAVFTIQWELNVDSDTLFLDNLRPYDNSPIQTGERLIQTPEGPMVGGEYVSTWVPSTRWIRDESGVVQSDAKLRITDWNVWVTGDGWNADIDNPTRTWPEQELAPGFNRVSFKQPNDAADLVLWNDSESAGSIEQIEWRGNYHKSGRRF